ncbi:addiction module antidote, HigA family domain protein [Rickettsia argasii T170-B]|uniref:Addiction module antidote, HigA family domain protein n=1 Tax=Rickettsia argasii T170-B TaxID=1268837 RepID=A0A0F3RGA2_9RICK|nr:addiction module antidote, HigA family domain protein [Rickettsia argasii T170-B]
MISYLALLVHGKRTLTVDMALRLGKYFHTSAQLCNLQARYDLKLAQRNEWPHIKIVFVLWK